MAKTKKQTTQLTTPPTSEPRGGAGESTFGGAMLVVDHLEALAPMLGLARLNPDASRALVDVLDWTNRLVGRVIARLQSPTTDELEHDLAELERMAPPAPPAHVTELQPIPSIQPMPGPKVYCSDASHPRIGWRPNPAEAEVCPKCGNTVA